MVVTLGQQYNVGERSTLINRHAGTPEKKNDAESAKAASRRGRKISRLYMDGWRDALNRLWRDGVTILPRPAKKKATAKNNRPVPALEKKKKIPPRPVPSKKEKKSHPVPPRKKKKPPCPASEKKKNRSVPPRKKKKPAPSRHEQQNTPPRGWKLETNTTACLFFSLSCCTFISYCSLVRSIF